MRYPVTTVTIFLIIVIGGLRLVPFFYDFRPLVQGLIAQSNATRVFTIDQYMSADVELIPAPTVTLYDAQLATPTVQRDVHVKSVQIEFSYFNLLFDQPIAKRVELSGLTLDVPQAMLQALFDLDLRRLPNTEFGIRDGDITFTARDGRLPLRFEDADIDLSMQGPYEPLKLSFAASLEGRHYAGVIKSRLPLDDQMPLEIAVTGDEALDLNFTGYFDRRAQAEISGEFSLASDEVLPVLLQMIGVEMAMPVPARAVFHGLFFADRRSVRADNIQLSVFGQQVELRANIDFAAPELADDIYIRLHAPRLNLRGLSYTGRRAQFSESPLASLSQVLFAQRPTVETMVTIDRLQLLDETIENVHLSAAMQADGLTLHRFDADLPFKTRIFLAGGFNLSAASPEFKGNIAVNSESATDALIWAGADLISPGVTTFIEDSELQRLSLSADISLDANHFGLTDLLGQVDGREYAVDVLVDRRSQDVDLSLHGASFDLSRWGGVLRGIDPGAVRLTTLPFEKWMQNLSATIGGDRKLSVIFGTPDFNIGAARLGRVDGAASFAQGRVRVHNLDIAQFEGSALKFSGDLTFENEQVLGPFQLTVDCAAANLCARRLEGMLAPLPISIEQPVTIASRWLLTGADETARSSMSMSAVISLGEAQGTLTLRAADTDFDILKRDAKLQLAISGRSADLLSAFALRDFSTIDPDQLGKITLDMSNTGRDAAALVAEFAAGERRATLDGIVRGLGPERQFEGNLSIRFGGKSAGLPGPDLSGTSQLSLSTSRASFSALNVNLGTGKISGEGVLKTDAERLNLTANLLLQNLDLSPYMPAYAQGWSQEPLSWPILGRADAVIEFRGENFALSSLAIETVQGRLRLIDGVLEAPDLTAQIYGGNVKFSLNAEGGNLLPYIETTGTFDGVDLEAGLAAFYDPPPLTGTLAGNFTFRGRGPSSDNFFRGSAGQVIAEGGAGELPRINAAQLIAMLSRAPVEPISDVAQIIAGRSRITRSRFELSLASGFLDFKTVSLDRGAEPGLQITGGLDVLNQTLDLDVGLRDGGVSQLQLRGDLLAPDLVWGAMR